YSAQIGDLANVVPNAVNPSLTDPTNAPGRVEIIADNLDLSRARIRAENFIQITTTNLISTTNADINAPIISYNLANTTTTLVLTNVIPGAVKKKKKKKNA